MHDRRVENMWLNVKWFFLQSRRNFSKVLSHVVVSALCDHDDRGDRGEDRGFAVCKLTNQVLSRPLGAPLQRPSEKCTEPTGRNSSHRIYRIFGDSRKTNCATFKDPFIRLIIFWNQSQHFLTSNKIIPSKRHSAILESKVSFQLNERWPLSITSGSPILLVAVSFRMCSPYTRVDWVLLFSSFIPIEFIRCMWAHCSMILWSSTQRQMSMMFI